MSISENDYFAMVNNIEQEENKNKPVYEYARNKNGDIEINTKSNNDNFVLNDNKKETTSNSMINEYENNLQKISIEIEMYKIMYKDYKKEMYKNYINSLNQKLMEENKKIKTLKKIKENINNG